MSYRTPGNNDSIDSLDESASDLMELDTPLPGRSNRTATATTGRRTRSSARAAAAARSASSSSTTSTTPAMSTPASTKSSNGEGGGEKFDMGPPPAAPTSAFRLGQPPLRPPSATQRRTKNGGTRSSNSSSGGTASSLVPSLDSLRQQVHVALREQDSPSSAIFYADALVTLSNHLPEDVLLLARAYAANGEHRRAVHLLEREGRLSIPYDSGDIDVRALLLGGTCYTKCEMWRECLELLHPSGMHYNGMDDEDEMEEDGGTDEHDDGGGDDDIVRGRRFERCLRRMMEVEDDETEEASDGRLGRIGHPSMLVASVYLLRGRAYEELDNRERAIEWYTNSLVANVGCVESFQRLIDQRMLSSEAEQALLMDLPWGPNDKWLCLLYQSKILTYQGTVDSSSDDNGIGVMRGEQQQQQAAAPPKERDVDVRFENVDRLCEMGSNIDVVTSKAECCLYEQNPQRAYELTTWIRERDPFNLRCASIHVSALVELGHKSELFYCAHNLVSAYPERAISWYSVACYYYTIGKFELARRYFSKATTKERQFAPAWIGFGNSFAAQDESDQAMAAYRTAQRLFPGSHVPLLCTGMEYLRTNNMALAQTYFNPALKMCPNDPLVYNELGVVHFKLNEYEQAEECFKQVLALCKHLPQTLMLTWEATYCNLGHCCRKLGRLTEASKYYETALGLAPKRASTYTSLGFVQHMLGNLDGAIDHYHQALGLRPSDTFAAEMLKRALEEHLDDTDDWMEQIPVQ